MTRRLLLGFLLLFSPLLLAHNLGTSYSHWQLSEHGAQVTARIAQLQLSRLALDPRFQDDYEHSVASQLSQDLQLWAGSEHCQARKAQARMEADGWVSARWQVTCQHPQPWTVRTKLLEAVAPSHLHFARVDAPGQPSQQRVLNFANPSLTLKMGEAPPEQLLPYIRIGFEHILTGWDHLAFIAVLILLAHRVREVVWLITGFTLAHSLTLAAASAGWVIVEQASIEALIGFSIALVAAENLWRQSQNDPWIPRLFLLSVLAFALVSVGKAPPLLMASLVLFSACYFAVLAEATQPQRWRLLLTFAFGLIHGFGFAGLMGELALPPDQFLWSLLGFNVGVELGQLVLIAAVWPLLRWLRRYPSANALGTQSVSAAFAGVGIFWFSTRLWG